MWVTHTEDHGIVSPSEQHFDRAHAASGSRKVALVYFLIVKELKCVKCLQLSLCL